MTTKKQKKLAGEQKARALVESERARQAQQLRVVEERRERKERRRQASAALMAARDAARKIHRDDDLIARD